LRLDKRPLEEAIKVLDWATQDEFWRPNILSMPTFREKYDTLRGQMMRNAEQKPASDSPEYHKRWVDPYAAEEAARNRANG
jgi:hypothetical protein